MPVSPRIGWWWALWIIMGIANQLSFRRTMHAETVDALLAASWLDIGSDFISLPAALVTIFMVRELMPTRSSPMRLSAAPPHVSWKMACRGRQTTKDRAIGDRKTKREEENGRGFQSGPGPAPYANCCTSTPLACPWGVTFKLINRLPAGVESSRTTRRGHSASGTS